MLTPIDSCQNRVSADQHHLAVSRAQVSTHRGRVFFELIRWQFTRFQMIAGSRLLFLKFISNMLCFCQYHHALLRLWFQTDLRCKNSVSFFKIQVGKTFYNHGHAPRPNFMLWLVKIWQVSSYVKFMQHLESCFSDSWSWQSFELTCDVFNCLFPLDVKNEIQSVLLFMAGLFIGFLVEKCVAWQSR